jgi:hypothetical protein
MKIIGKPYSGKPNVRFDEGELEIELLATTPALYSTESLNIAFLIGGICENEDSFLKSSRVNFNISTRITTDNQQFPKMKGRAIFLPD